MSLDFFDPIGNRYIDVGSGGPAPFTFTASANVSWLHLTPSKGSISPNSPESRVFATVDWSKVSGEQAATITFTAKASGQPNLVQTVGFFANHTTVPKTFKGMYAPYFLRCLAHSLLGFVQGSGAVSIEAAHTSKNTSVGGISWIELPGYGRTVSGITPWPRGDNNFTAGTGPSVYVHPNAGGIFITDPRPQRIRLLQLQHHSGCWQYYRHHLRRAHDEREWHGPTGRARCSG